MAILPLLAEMMVWIRFEVNLDSRSYQIALTAHDSNEFGTFLHEITPLPKTTQTLVVCDANTHSLGRKVEAALSAAGFRSGFATVTAGEESKSATELHRLYDALYELAADRNTCVVAVGGGVVGDLAGFTRQQLTTAGFRSSWFPPHFSPWSIRLLVGKPASTTPEART